MVKYTSIEPERLISLLKEHGVRGTARVLKVSPQTICNWKELYGIREEVTFYIDKPVRERASA